MIVVDTNVISELTRPRPSPIVVSWFSEQDVNELWTTAITEAEILVGVALTPDGKRKSELDRINKAVMSAMFADRILPFDSRAAQQFPSVVVERRRHRLDIDEADAQIAAIARLHGVPVATRNVAHFSHCGIEIINPWNL